jgi:hypothetical protein
LIEVVDMIQLLPASAVTDDATNISPFSRTAPKRFRASQTA